ncbi:hypothetical protein [Mesorhizobium sp. M1E.F.Ca.ET.063.01.1.1]|uniref:hypothetical protein n=1 Tax=Mesorhizobium sp. M1E.F.Ca.ET.063.01.1.1 TaxID=2496750 RepID=UPI000FCC148D|nr:hypothetical protein [Mesorhizobium sp. M1E.F.Ca.ET.063.01.1.1]RUW85205.1 hypothetical protein EOA29_06005 [Mesorhizobium sp. M1E.F.Ca.ET.063.01.1.1]
MAFSFDINGTVNALVSAIQKQAKQGWTTISTLVAQQAKMMAQQAAWIAESSVAGALKNDAVLQHLFVDQLADSVRNLAADIAALTILTIEKVWNAAVNVLWTAINKVLSSASMGILALPAL